MGRHSYTSDIFSPLSFTLAAILPGRPIFPRSKQEPDLYRVTLKTYMRGTLRSRIYHDLNRSLNSSDYQDLHLLGKTKTSGNSQCIF